MKINIVSLLESKGISDIIDKGAYIQSPCPVHHGDNPTGFVVYKNSGKWRCWTKGCHIGKDSIYDLAKLLNTNLSEFKYNTTITVDISPRRKKIVKPIPIYKFIKKMGDQSRYFKRIGFNESTIRSFMMFDMAKDYHPMRDRACIPVIDEKGWNVIGLTGRTLYPQCVVCDKHHPPLKDCEDGHVPKWKHYGFESGKTIFNWHNANKIFPYTRSCVIVESPKNACWLYQNGITNAIAIFGVNNINERLINRLRWASLKRIIWGVDNDEAGNLCIERYSQKLSKYFAVESILNYIPSEKDIADVPEYVIQNEIRPFVLKY